MTTVIGGISIFLEDDTQRFAQSVRNNAALVEQQSARMTRALGGTAGSIEDLNKKASSFRFDTFRQLANNALSAQTALERLRSSMLAIVALTGGGFTGAFATKVLADTADQYANIRNKIAAVTTDTRQRAQVEEEIYAVSQRTRSALEATATQYQRLKLSADNLGAAHTDILRVVETTQKGLKLGGATTQESTSAAIQLSQALGSGRLQGDELRSILENAPVLAQAIAKHFGVAVGELKQMGSEGKLIGRDVFQAILKSSGSIDESFSGIKPTIESSLIVLDNAFTRYLGRLDQSVGASAALAQGIISLANNFQTFGDAVVYAGGAFAAFLAARGAARLGSAVGSPLAAARAEYKDREGALAAAKAAEQAASGRLVDVNMQRADLMRRARGDVDQFADKDVLRDRERTRRAYDADLKALAEAEKKYQDALKGFDEVDRKARERTFDSLARGTDMKPFRDSLSAANRELRAAQAEVAKLTDAAPVEQAYERRLNALQRREDKANERRATALKRIVAATPDEVGDLDRVSKLPGEAEKIRMDQRLRTIGDERAKIAQEIAAAEVAAADRAVAANGRVETAKRAVLNAEKELGTAVTRRGAAEFGAANNTQMGALAQANAQRFSARQRADLGRDLLGASNEEVSRSGAAALQRELTALQIPATQAAQQYKLAQDGVAAATQRVSAIQAAAAATTRMVTSAFSGLIGFLGGPLGAAIFAATAGFAIYEIAQAKAAQRADEFKVATEGAAQAVQRLKIAQADGLPALNSALSLANANIATLQSGLTETIANALQAIPSQPGFQTDANGITTLGMVPQAGLERLADMGKRLDEIRRNGGDTRSTLQDLAAEIDRLGSLSVDMAGVLGPLRALIGTALAGASALRSIRDAASEAAAARGDFDDARDARARRANQLDGDSARRADLNQQRLRTERTDADSEEFKDNINRRTKTLADAVGNYERELDRQTLEAAGKKIDARMVGLRQQYPGIDEGELRRLAELQEKNKGGGGSGKKSEDEKFRDRLERLQEEGRAGFFTDLDRSLIEELKKIKGEPKLLRDTVDAIKSGSPLPEQAQRLREALAMKDAGKEYRELVTNYGSLEQIIPMISAEQEKFNILLKEGKISADQAALGMADYLGKFKSLKWIDNVADSFKAFGTTLSDALFEGKLGFEKLNEAGRAFAKSLFEIAMNEALLTPLRNLLRGGMSIGVSGGGGILSSIGSLFGFGGGGGGGGSSGQLIDGVMWQHGGGPVMGSAGGRSVSANLFANAPRLHSGTRLGAREHARILEEGEEVLTRNQRRGIIGTMRSLTDMKGGRGDPQVNIYPPAGHQAEVTKRESGSGFAVDAVIKRVISQDFASGGEISQGLEGMYGLNRMAGRRS